MNYRLINTTNIPTDDIHTAILFTAPKRITNFNVEVHYGDRHLWDAWACPWKKIPVAKFYFQKETLLFPQTSHWRSAKKGGYYPICVIKNMDELIIALFAHELRHIWQATVSNQDFRNQEQTYWIDNNGVEQTSNYKMERDACQYAKKMLERYRRL